MCDKDVDTVLKKLQEQYRYESSLMKPSHAHLSKYKFMESQLSQRKIVIKSKLPDIKRTLDTVNFLIAKKVCLLNETSLYVGTGNHDNYQF